MTTPTELSIELPSLTLRAQAWGDASLPPLLALHGWLDNAGSYALLAPLLADRWQVIALDLPGHGHSDHLPADAHYHFVDYVRAVLAAADALKLERYALLGHSLGAGIAALIAAATPARIERLLLIEGLGPIGDDGSHTLQRFRDALMPQRAASRPLRSFRDIAQAISARTLASGLRPELARPIVERGLFETTQPPDEPLQNKPLQNNMGLNWRSDPRLTRSTPVRLAESQVHALLHGIEAPTALLLAQPATPYLPSHPMHLRAACVANIAVSHMDGGHHLHLEHPQAVADWIGSRP
ncbi:alpha/beta fold hydrolase [Dyella tabacisoli]|uniref:Alpha/beta hydrolase n=1 Tax=Dyella tabacisoli TaxID=2282381 RepID=A0A369UR25_9GAMM|nr:alpha/beta hydrolase [Dyella tabacisoli]RDD80769.1 alpha/beta hydrolase [Dyella tabacisoli]